MILENTIKKRPPAVASMFYPGVFEELRSEVRKYLRGNISKQNTFQISKFKLQLSKFKVPIPTFKVQIQPP